jgi:hypothetical protein
MGCYHVAEPKPSRVVTRTQLAANSLLSCGLPCHGPPLPPKSRLGHLRHIEILRSLQETAPASPRPTQSAAHHLGRRQRKRARQRVLKRSKDWTTYPTQLAQIQPWTYPGQMRSPQRRGTMPIVLAMAIMYVCGSKMVLNHVVTV